jgi:hypothetical protein
MWKQHLMQSYSEEQADAFLCEWSKEDVYQPLTAEQEMLRSAGFVPEVLWRKGAFAVVLALKS